MKNLKIASDKEIYDMLELLKLFNCSESSNRITKNMEKELNIEFERRQIVVPLAWDLERSKR